MLPTQACCSFSSPSDFLLLPDFATGFPNDLLTSLLRHLLHLYAPTILTGSTFSPYISHISPMPPLYLPTSSQYLHYISLTGSTFSPLATASKPSTSSQPSTWKRAWYIGEI